MSNTKFTGIQRTLVCKIFFQAALSCLVGSIGAIAGVPEKSGDSGGYVSPPGFNFKILATMDLGKEFDGMVGYGLRLVETTVRPGGVVAMHSHKEKPQIIYILEGTLTEQKEGMPPVDYEPGDIMLNTGDVTHTFYNRTSKPVLYIHTAIKPGLDGP